MSELERERKESCWNGGEKRKRGHAGVPPADLTSLASVSRLIWYSSREMFAAVFWSLCPNCGRKEMYVSVGYIHIGPWRVLGLLSTRILLVALELFTSISSEITTASKASLHSIKSCLRQCQCWNGHRGGSNHYLG